MSDIAVTVTSPGSVNATIGVGGAVSATVSSGGSVAVQLPSGSLAWVDITGKPTEFAPAAHTHDSTQITDFKAAVIAISGEGPGAELSDATPLSLGTAGPGTAFLASRADHVHALPTAADLGLATVATSGDYADLTNTPGNYTLPTATDTTLGGVKIGSGITITDGVISAEGGGGVSLSDVPPQVLGNVSAGTGLLASREDHVHPMPTAADVGALDIDSVIDGGDYVGVIVIPSPTIQITSHPGSQTVYVTSTATWSAAEQTTSQPTGSAYSRSLLSDGTTAVFLASDGIWSSSNSGSSWSLSSRTWTNSVSYEQSLISGYGDGKWVVVDVLGKVSYTATSSPTNSASWAETSSNGFSYIPDGSLNYPLNGQRRIVFGNSLYLAASYEQVANWVDGSGNITGTFRYNMVQRSADGITWTAADPPSGDTGLVEAFAYDSVQSRFVMACVHNTQSANYVPQRTYKLFYSDDGIAWTEATVPAMSSGVNIFSDASRSVAAFGAGKFVIKPNYHVSDVFVSSDGITWTKHTGPGFVANDLHYDGSFFVAIGDGAYATSPDGITWTNRAAAAGNWYSAALVGTKTIARDDGYTPNSTLAIDRTITQSGADASFSVSAYISSGTLTYQWEVSEDSGATWANVSGGEAATLSLEGMQTADSGRQYRAIVSAAGADSVTSNAATLTVL